MATKTVAAWSTAFTTQVLEDSVVPFLTLFWCFGDVSWEITDFFPDVLADKPHP